MPTPSELVTDSFSQAHNYASESRDLLLSFTARLEDNLQAVPLVDVSWLPIEDPGVATVPEYVAPADYNSALLTAVTAQVTARLAGGTGIDPAVEADIWDRAREREIAVMQGAIDTLTRDTESLGFQLPPGILVDGIRREQRAYYDRVSTLSRDIAVKQADLEQVNAQKAIEHSIQIEQATGEIVYKRSEVSLNAYRAEIEAFKAGVDQDVKHWEVQIRQYEATQTFTFNALKLNGELVRANASINLEAAKVGTQAFAQLLASAYSMIHASASVSAGASMSVSYSYSNDTATAPASITSV